MPADAHPYHTLFAYHWQTTQRLIEGAARLDDAAYRASPGYGHGSVHGLLFHLLRTARSWRRGLEEGRQLSGIEPEAFPDLDALRAGFADERRAWQALLEGLSAEDVTAAVSLTNWRGDVWAIPRWRILQHLVLHGMQHHAELARLLTEHGQPPGDLDFIFFRDADPTP